MKRIALAFFATGLMQLSSFASGVLLARTLGPAMRGEVAQIIAWFSFIAPVMLFGINDSVTYFKSRKAFDPGAILLGSMVIAIPLVLLASTICIFIINTVFYKNNPLAISAAWLFILFIPLNNLQQILFSYLQTSKFPKMWTFVRIIPGWTYIFGVLLISHFYGANTFNVIAMNLASIGLALLLCVAVVVRAGDKFSRPTFDMMSKMFRFGLPLVFQRIALSCQPNLDRMILPFFVATSALAHYVVAASVAYLIFAVGVTVDLIGFPAMARVHDDAERRRIAETCISLTFCSLVIAVGSLALLVRPMVLFLFGHEYEASIALVPWFLVAGAAQALRLVVGSAFKAFNFSGRLAGFEFLSASIMALILFGTSSRLGIFAGVLAHIASAFVSLGVAFAGAVYTLKLSPRHIFIPHRSDIAMIWKMVRRGSWWGRAERGRGA